MTILLMGAGKGGVGVGGYQGPGDVVSGWTSWNGLRAFSAAYALAGSPIMDVVDTATGLITTTINALPNGDLDQATITGLGYAVSITKLYDQTPGGTAHVINVTLADMPTLTVNGIGGTKPLFVSTATQFLETSVTITQAQPFVTSAFARRTSTTIENDLGLCLAPGAVSFGFLASGEVFAYADNVAIVTGISENAFHAIQFTFNGASADIYIDGTPNSVDTGTGTMGAPVWYNNALTGNLQERGILDGTLSSPQKSQLNSQQHTYWGV